MEKRLVLKTGYRGDDVALLQTLLKIKADGIFGVKTRERVVEFQKMNGLRPDGIVGPLTWEKLEFNPEEFWADTDTTTSASWIERYHLPEGEYVKKWIPELKNITKKFIHKPWEIKDDKYFKLGRDYPFPIVKHEEARANALIAFKKI